MFNASSQLFFSWIYFKAFHQKISQERAASKDFRDCLNLHEYFLWVVLSINLCVINFSLFTLENSPKRPFSQMSFYSYLCLIVSPILCWKWGILFFCWRTWKTSFSQPCPQWTINNGGTELDFLVEANGNSGNLRLFSEMRSTKRARIELRVFLGTEGWECTTSVPKKEIDLMCSCWRVFSKPGPREIHQKLHSKRQKKTEEKCPQNCCEGRPMNSVRRHIKTNIHNMQRMCIKQINWSSWESSKRWNWGQWSTFGWSSHYKASEI